MHAQIFLLLKKIKYISKCKTVALVAWNSLEKDKGVPLPYCLFQLKFLTKFNVSMHKI